MKYYVVTDIHGFYKEMEISLREKGFFDDKEERKLIICGDLLDRGEEPIEVQDFVMDLLKKDQVILIRGNHEDLLVNLIEEAPKWFNQDISETYHYSNGTVESALRLVNESLPNAILHPEDFAKRVKETPFYKTILPSMKNYFETKNYIFVHGWIPCTVIGEGISNMDTFLYEKDWREANTTRWERVRWLNGMAAASRGVIEPNKTIVCGHWHCSYAHAKLEGKGEEFGATADFSPYYGKGIIALDTCTAYSGKVNCIILEDD